MADKKGKAVIVNSKKGGRSGASVKATHTPTHKGKKPKVPKAKY